MFIKWTQLNQSFPLRCVMPSTLRHEIQGDPGDTGHMAIGLWGLSLLLFFIFILY